MLDESGGGDQLLDLRPFQRQEHGGVAEAQPVWQHRVELRRAPRPPLTSSFNSSSCRIWMRADGVAGEGAPSRAGGVWEIGRASCRERV